MKPKNPRRKGSLLVMAIGMMILVEFLTVNQLQSIKMSFNLSQHLGFQKSADLASRSGIDYGYSMIKNVMESMSMVDLRFATHTTCSTANSCAEVLPSWQEILNPVYDKRARDDSNTNSEGNWIGTDSYSLASTSESPYGNQDPRFPYDYVTATVGDDDPSDGYTDTTRSMNPGLKTTNATYGYTTDTDGEPGEPGSGFDVNNTPGTLRECAEENIGTTTYTLHWSGHITGQYNAGECAKQASYHTPNTWDSLYTGLTSLDPFETNIDYVRDGHFGTKRWHYYDQWNFTGISHEGTSGEDVKSDIDSSLPRGTGGMIRYSPNNLSSFANHRHLLFERLFNYRRDNSTGADLQYPYEPLKTDETNAIEKEADQNAYHVQLQTVVDLDGLSFTASGDAALFDHTDFQNLKFKVFFKLWVTRDEQRDGYNGELSNTVTRVTTAFVTHDIAGTGNALTGSADFKPLRDRAGFPCGSNALTCQANCDVACDLHPFWSHPVETGNSSKNAYWRANYINDFLDTDGNGNNSQRLGVLQFPVPFLAFQRGDKDYWLDSFGGTSFRGSRMTTQTTQVHGLPVDHTSYTKFTLWSLGTVREVKENGRSGSIAEAEQRINDFEIVARALYKMDFYMDVRVADVNNESDYRDEHDQNITIKSGGCDEAPDQVKDPHKDLNNTLYYISRFVPACDVDPEGKVIQLFEPLGIYLAGTEKVDYMDSDVTP